MAAITTNKQAQSAIIKYYSDALIAQGIQPIKSSRGGAHLRINYAGDFSALLNKILPCSIKPTDVSISGTYVTQELTINKAIPNARIGDKIYLVIAVSSKGVLKTKQLVPDKLGFAGAKISKRAFMEQVKSGVAKSDAPDNIKAFLLELTEVSAKPFGQIQSDHLGSISDSDINIIAKDFGEISGAYWFMHQFNKKVDAISYPKESNAALVDYYAHIGDVRIAISAKANEGAPPSIDAIAAILKDIKYTDINKEAARKAIIAISENTTIDGIVEASKDLQTAGYKWLKKTLFRNNDFTAADIEPILSGYKSPLAVAAELKPFYDVIKRSASAEITKRIFDTNAKRNGLIISPMGYSLVDELNTNQTYLSVLNDAANTIVVSQIYIKINKSSKTVSYNVKEFSSSAFKFEYNANAGQPSLKKISFKMDKKAI
jgi:hypothetical protein